MKLLLGGEGKTELGGWFDEAPYRDEQPAEGVVEALLKRVKPDGWRIVAAVPWTKIRKFKAGDHARAEARNVLGLALEARDRGCDAVVFVRDRDSDKERQRDVEEGLRLVAERFQGMGLMGGVAVEMTEAWILALRGEPGAEQHRDPKQRLAERHGIAIVAEKVAAVASARLDALPSDAKTLVAWLARAEAVLGRQAS